MDAAVALWAEKHVQSLLCVVSLVLSYALGTQTELVGEGKKMEGVITRCQAMVRISLTTAALALSWRQAPFSQLGTDQSGEGGEEEE